jgi:hypothetical protein
MPVPLRGGVGHVLGKCGGGAGKLEPDLEFYGMGVLSHLLIADVTEASTVASSDEPADTWRGFFCRGIDSIKLAALWAVVECGSADDRLDERLGAIRTLSNSDQGPWVDVVPQEMLALLATIAAMEELELEAIADKWHSTDELKDCDALHVLDLVRNIGDTAETAQLQKKGLLIWTSL